MEGKTVIFNYGGTWDRKPLEGVGLVDETCSYKGREYWHIKPVEWSQGSPLPKWVPAGSVAVINAETPAFARAS